MGILILNCSKLKIKLTISFDLLVPNYEGALIHFKEASYFFGQLLRTFYGI